MDKINFDAHTVTLIAAALPAIVFYNVIRERSELIRQIGAVIVWLIVLWILRFIFT
ncbi:MAG: hypothetical protein MK036_03035 [Dehalococcoidia bacterium]|nr:hypothetical protein [Dehalococcoidia bacterium]